MDTWLPDAILTGIVSCLVLAALVPMGVSWAKLIADMRSHNKVLRSDRMRLKIPADCSQDEFGRNFIVELECLDGTVVRVLIPIDSNSVEGLCSRVSDNNQEPLGLNLVCSGHYN